MDLGNYSTRLDFAPLLLDVKLKIHFLSCFGLLSHSELSPHFQRSRLRKASVHATKLKELVATPSLCDPRTELEVNVRSTHRSVL